ncbi:MAG: FIVAR domain-containing protein, partial [Clostridia bacterium]|nr:FIVAR domain-containing protein [Clostridia bacterium]
EGATEAVNELADKTALKAALENAIKEQGDYTAESFEAYTAAVNNANEVYNYLASTKAAVENAVTAIEKAALALENRTPTEKEGEKAFLFAPEAVEEITVKNYVDDNGLSALTYEVASANAEVATVSEIEGGKFTITAVADGDTTVTLYVSFKGEVVLSVEYTISVRALPSLKEENIVKSFDIYDLENKEKYYMDFAANVENPANFALTYSATVSVNGGEDSEIELTDNGYTFALDGEYGETATAVTFKVTISYERNGTQNLTYNYVLNITDTSAFKVVNSGFENGLDGWTRNTTHFDNGKEVGGITDAPTFWNEGYPMFNKGNYFAAYAEDSAEGSMGTLTSSSFVLGGTGYITYMLGGAGNPLCYITVEKLTGEEWTTVAIYRNTKFADLPQDTPEKVYTLEEKMPMIGNTVFLANFVTFKADLSAYKGETLRFVIHDEATGGWGLVFFDELNTYYASEDQLPEGATEAVNELADKTALKAALENAIKEQGDYTAESFAAYNEVIAAAREVYNYVAAKNVDVQSAVTAIEKAASALEYRTPTEKEAEKSFVLAPKGTQEIDVKNYVDENGLSAVTYELSSANAEVATVSETESGKFTITAAADGKAVVTLDVKFLGNTVLSVYIDVYVRTAPSLKEQSVTKDIDLYSLENKESYTVDFTSNVANPANIDFAYSATMSVNGGDASEIELTDNGYTYALNGEYDYNATVVTFAVTVAYDYNGTQYLTYNYTLNIVDTTAYRLVNGGFEKGDLTGWTLSNASVGAVSGATHYWINDPESADGFAFGMDGKYMFSAYATDVEAAKGVLTSSEFTIGGSGYITYKLGGAKNANGVWMDVVDSSNGNILARFYNNEWQDRTDGVKSGCTLVPYVCDLSAFIDKTVYLRIVDNAVNDYGLFFLDSVNTYYAEMPIDGFKTAVPVENRAASIYEIYNGGFETGNLDGWNREGGELGHVTSADRFFSGNTYNKDGTYLFSGIEDFEGKNGKEGEQGTLSSAPFVVGGTGYITFKLGGGINDACYIDIVDFSTGALIARYHNDKPATEGANPEGVMVLYKAYLGAQNIGKTAIIRICDYAWHAWGCLSADSFATYYASEEDLPAGCAEAADKKFMIVNGGFETGAFEGWASTNGELGNVSDVRSYWGGDFGMEGNFMFSAYATDVESAQGIITSSSFVVGGTGYITYKLGGAKNGARKDNCAYIDVVDATTGDILGRYYNDRFDALDAKCG